MSAGPATTEVDAALAELQDPDADALGLANKPVAADTVGRALAAAIADEVGPADVVAVWEAPNDAVLAHVVARELGAGVIQASNIEGILELDVPLSPDARVIVLADEFRNENALVGLVSIVSHRGGQVVGVAAVYGSPVLDISSTEVARTSLRPVPNNAAAEESVR